MRAIKQGLISTAAAYLAMAFLILPLLAVIPVSFTAKRYLSMPDGDWSLRHYTSLLENEAWLSSIKTSFLIALTVAMFSTLLSVLFCVGIWYLRSHWTRILFGVVLIPMAVPPIISALTLYFFVTSAGIHDTITGTVLAHLTVAVPYAVIAVMVSISQVDRSLEQASRNLGASILQTTVWVVLPNIKLGIASAAFLSFILSWEEVSVTLFVTSVETITLPRNVWSGLRDNIDPSIAAISVVLTALTIAVILGKMIAAARQKAGP